MEPERENPLITDYINKHTVMGMLSANYVPFGDWSGFYRNKTRTKVTVFDPGFDGDFKETAFHYVPDRMGKGYSSTLLVSRFDSAFFALAGAEHKEIRETRNKWDRLVSVREEPSSVGEVVALVDKWDILSGSKYGFNRHSGYDRNFFRRYWETERSNLYSLFFYHGDALVGYSVVSKLQDDNCFRYVIRKMDIGAGRNICLYIDYKTFESIWRDRKGCFYVNWGASSGKVLKYKEKFPTFKECRVWFHKKGGK